MWPANWQMAKKEGTGAMWILDDSCMFFIKAHGSVNCQQKYAVTYIYIIWPSDCSLSALPTKPCYHQHHQSPSPM